MALSDVPDDGWLEAMIFVAKDVPDPGNLGPAHIGMSGFLMARYPAAGFGDDLQAALNGALQRPTLTELRKFDASQRLLDTGDRVSDVFEPNADGSHPGQNTCRAEPSIEARSRGWMLPRLITSARVCNRSAIRS